MRDETKPIEVSAAWLRELYDFFEPVRRSFAESGMTEEEINAQIDTAIQEARAESKRDPLGSLERHREWLDAQSAEVRRLFDPEP